MLFHKDNINTFIYKGNKKDKEINLAYGDGHFDTIVSMRGYFQVDIFCHDCKKSRGQTHICSEKCQTCQDTECQIFPASPREIHCADCKLYFINETCFNSHKKPSIGKLSRCQVYDRCEECGKIINGNRHPKHYHDCNLIECTYCRQFEPKDHLCFIQSKAKQQDNEEELGEEIDEEVDEVFEFQTKKKKKSSEEPEFRYLFFHLESMTLDQMHEDAYGNENYYAKKHKVNCTVAQKSCSFCQDKGIAEYCNFCHDRETIFMGDDCQRKFLQVVVLLRKLQVHSLCT